MFAKSNAAIELAAKTTRLLRHDSTHTYTGSRGLTASSAPSPGGGTSVCLVTSVCGTAGLVREKIP